MIPLNQTSYVFFSSRLMDQSDKEAYIQQGCMSQKQNLGFKIRAYFFYLSLTDRFQVILVTNAKYKVKLLWFVIESDII